MNRIIEISTAPCTFRRAVNELNYTHLQITVRDNSGILEYPTDIKNEYTKQMITNWKSRIKSVVCLQHRILWVLAYSSAIPYLRSKILTGDDNDAQ